MGCRRWTSSSFPFFLLCLPFLSWDAHICSAADTLYPSQSLTGKQTIVSEGGNFQLGFFSPGNSRNQYIGIWYQKIANQTVVWVANRDNPLSHISSSELKISEDGNLVLLDHSKKTPVWSSNSTSSKSNSTVAVLLDSGNLVLRDHLDPSVIIWQSFDHPTDTWLPGGWVGVNKITGEYQMLTSWKNSEDPARGRFSESLDPSGSNQHVLMWNRSRVYWQSGVWNGQIFTQVPGMQERVLFNLSFVDTKEKKYSTYTIGSETLVTRSVMDSSGQVKQWVWVDSTQEWLLIWAQPVALCDVFSVCGVNGVCDHKTMSCECLHGFEPASVREWQLNDWGGGCRRKTSLRCSGNESAHDTNEGFLVLPGMKLPENAHHLKAQSIGECELACRNNCSCTAFAYGDGCSIWRGDLWNLQQLPDGEDKQGTLHLRLPVSELPITSTNNRGARMISVFAVAGAVVLLCIALRLLWWCRWRRRPTGLLEAVEGSLVQFTYAELQRVTKNFSEKIGSGGFGTVFKGIFPDSTAVAVKKLEGLRQGDKQFRNEVSTLGNIQHVNLVRLRGFCSEGSKRLLVYDYMPNGSLDHHLFRGNAAALNWRRRFAIVLGVARALAYLHEKCRDCIIHCDLKPENILLDGDFHPKVADMGMAKLVGRDYSRVLTTMRGTFGYLAPEWISGLPITPKADVYSFGMTVFEVISGRRNSDHSAAGKAVGYFPIWAANKLREGEVSCLLDERLAGDADMDKLCRACKVACWCIQDSEVHRPSMGQVVQILEGVLEVEVAPIPVSLGNLMDDHSASSPSITHLLANSSPQWSTQA